MFLMLTTAGRLHLIVAVWDKVGLAWIHGVWVSILQESHILQDDAMQYDLFASHC
jgi:type III secretory pathway component EscS